MPLAACHFLVSLLSFSSSPLLSSSPLSLSFFSSLSLSLLIAVVSRFPVVSRVSHSPSSPSSLFSASPKPSHASRLARLLRFSAVALGLLRARARTRTLPPTTTPPRSAWMEALGVAAGKAPDNDDRALATALDACDPIAPLRNEFEIPTLATLHGTATGQSTSAAASRRGRACTPCAPTRQHAVTTSAAAWAASRVCPHPWNVPRRAMRLPDRQLARPHAQAHSHARPGGARRVGRTVRAQGASGTRNAPWH